jgi:hypothetical protein
MAKYRKRPVVIDAVQFDPGAEKWPDGVVRMEGEWASTASHAAALGVSPAHCGWVPGLEGGHVAMKGDWIITGVKGERYPCKPDVFAATYEPVGRPGEVGDEDGQ